jgi:hypothetical protein
MVPITISTITKTEGINTGRRIVETLDDLSVVVLSEVIASTPALLLNFGANISQLERSLAATAAAKTLQFIAATPLQFCLTLSQENPQRNKKQA